MQLIIKFKGQFLECNCGNNQTKEGFSPCNEDGKRIVPNRNCPGLFACNKCDQKYKIELEDEE
ncbi:hypothetical protein [Gottfriedia solisilvae]|uniref:hypothetical protein n=1 Tax=Gottfriedia solisilvae TaxID=1516104 RepID=UPI003D2ED2AE